MSRTWAYTLRDGQPHGEIFDAGSVPAGWADTPAKLGDAPVADDADKDALVERAKALGLRADKRFSPDRLRDMIKDAEHGNRG